MNLFRCFVNVLPVLGMFGVAFVGINEARSEPFSISHTFNDPTPTGADYFGGSLSVSGENVLIGSAGDDTNGIEAGQAHLFSATTGALLQTFNDPMPMVGTYSALLCRCRGTTC